MKEVYTIYSYEDQEIKAVFSSMKEVDEWIKENRKGNEDDCHVEQWPVDFKEEK